MTRTRNTDQRETTARTLTLFALAALSERGNGAGGSLTARQITAGAYLITSLNRNIHRLDFTMDGGGEIRSKAIENAIADLDREGLTTRRGFGPHYQTRFEIAPGGRTALLRELANDHPDPKASVAFKATNAALRIENARARQGNDTDLENMATEVMVVRDRAPSPEYKLTDSEKAVLRDLELTRPERETFAPTVEFAVSPCPGHAGHASHIYEEDGFSVYCPGRVRDHD